MTRMQDIRKKNDALSRRSATSIQQDVERLITKVFVTALECIEIKFGKEFDGYDELRAKILRVGNDAKRGFQEAVLPKYNVEKVPETTVVVKAPEQADDQPADAFVGDEAR